MGEKILEKILGTTGKAHILCDASPSGRCSLEVRGDESMIFASVCEIIREIALSNQHFAPKDYVEMVREAVLMELENEPAGGNRTGSGTE